MNSVQINQKLNRNQQGLTLVEVMVAMTIGLVLLGGVVTVMSSSQSTYRVNEAMARMQENARYAFQLLSRDIRMAGYRGCRGDIVTITNVLNGKTDFLWRFDQPLEGYEATSANGWDPTLPSEITVPLTGGNMGRDIIVLRGVESNYAKVISHASESADLVVEGGGDIKTGNAVLVSNCQGAAIFKATGVVNHLRMEKWRKLVRDLITFGRILQVFLRCTGKEAVSRPKNWWKELKICRLNMEKIPMGIRL